jgi:hypothetical protein
VSTVGLAPQKSVRLVDGMGSASRKSALCRILLALVLSLLLHFLVLLKVGIFREDGVAVTGGALRVNISPRASQPRPATEPAVKGVVATSPGPAPSLSKKPTRALSSQRGREPAPRVPEPGSTLSGQQLPADVTASMAAKALSGKPAAGVPIIGRTEPVRRVAIEFEIFSGANRQIIAEARHRYVSENAEYYGVSIEQTGNADKPSRIEISGRVTPQGLSPLLYEIQGTLPERLMALQGTTGVSSASAADVRKGRFRDGLLDRQSMLYQFMIRPPDLVGGQMWLTDGRVSELYTYRWAGFETLVIAAFGEVRALKLLLSAAQSGDDIELWLLPELHYLPVKVRYSDKQGSLIEQMAVSLEYE